jgi:hypothetical protein
MVRPLCAGQTGMVLWMKVPDGEELATRTSPESCATARKDRGEALTGGRVGQVFSRERTSLRGADAVKEGGRQQSMRRYRETHRIPARSKTLCTHGSTMLGSREIPGLPAVIGTAGRVGKPKGGRRR